MQSGNGLWSLRLPFALVALAILALLNASHAVVRLTDPWSNYAVFFFCLILPSIATLLVVSRTRGWYRVASLLIGVPWSLASLGFAFLVTMDLTSSHFGGPDPYWTPIQEVAYGPSRLIVYQTDCGATCAIGVAVRQEMDIAPGVLLVRDLWSRYEGETAHVDVARDGSATIDGLRLSLRWHVYF